MSSYHELPRVIAVHRALGGYFAVYSEGVTAMRHAIESFLSPTEVEFPQNDKLFHILFAGMTAKPTADAFFGMATVVAGLTQPEVALRNVLRREWEHQTSFRNDLAHAKWALGWEKAETGEPAPPGSIRIKTIDGVPTLVDLGIDANAIIDEINRLNPLVRQIRIFGRVCRKRQRSEDIALLDYFEVVEPTGAEARSVSLIERQPPGTNA